MSDAERPARILPVIIVSQFAGSSLWFAGNAILPELQRDWGLAADAPGHVTAAVQFGFIAGTLVFALLALADRFSPRAVFLVCALAGAGANLALVALPPSFAALLLLRFATGFCLAGIYPVGMKIAAGWYASGLGRALGWLVGALVVGTAFPHLLRGLGAALPWAGVLAGVSACAALGGLAMYWLVPDGPQLKRGARFDPGAVRTIFAGRELRSAAFGYFGHMWELYTWWAFLPAIVAAWGVQHGTTPAVSLWSFAAIAAGALGCIIGGELSPRWGSARVAQVQLAVSCACCLLAPLAFGLPGPLFFAYLLVWGITVVGDSPQFSTLTARAAPPAYLGSALTWVTAIGFGITVVSIQLFGSLVQHWPIAWLLPLLALGPLPGLLAIRPLAGHR
ncbi:MAG: MFS transporter [Lysobacterales bacterium]|nr:MAG: MFS transporter [Xanthomonadales bacterium]